MPNHIQNRLKVMGPQNEVKKLLEFISGQNKDGEKIPMDFRKIKPMPESLEIESSSRGEIALSLLFGGVKKYDFLSLKEKQKRMREMGEELRNEEIKNALAYWNNIQSHGHPTWYEWAIEHWGTKWNAYSQPDERNNKDTVFFQTAWSPPVDLMTQLSTMFPEVSLHFDWADEDSGSNTGKVVLQGGQEKEVYQPENQSKEAYDLFFDLHPHKRGDYEFVDGKYEYKDQD